MLLLDYTAKEILENLILIRKGAPEPHELLTAVCLARLSESGLDLRHPRPPSKQDPFLSYAYDSWSIHARQSRDNLRTRARLTEFAQSRPFPIKLRTLALWDPGYALLGPLHLLAYFNLPIALAGPAQLENPNIPALRQECVKDSSSETSSQMPDTLEGTTALCLACQEGHCIAVKELLELSNILVNKAGVDKTTPLMWAARGGHEGVTCLLLARPEIEVNAVDCDGRTALDWASLYGNVGIARLLISHPKIIVNAANDVEGNTPLHNSSRLGYKHVVELLLARHDVDVNAQNYNGETALSQASRWGVEDTVKHLLSHPKVELNKKDNGGRTPLGLAAENGEEGVVKLLLSKHSIQVGTMEMEAARTGVHWTNVRTKEARSRILALLEEFLNRAKPI